MNANWIYRLNIEMGLQLRNKTPKRRVKAKLREWRIAANVTKQVENALDGLQ